ncbi:MAG: hypothetical protein ABI443_11845 [Chthoniobacterales bacterium]
MNSELWGRINKWTHRFSPLLLLLFAIAYYGSYYRSGLNLGGEGGTGAVISQRIMEGQRPMADIFLGYNVLWFYPVVWLFQLFGPSYIALRIFFFALCTISGLLAYRIVWRVTGKPIYALIVGGILIFVPGMIFRNYMGLLGLLNMLTLLEAYVLPHSKIWQRLVWIAAAGATLALTFLTRVEIGFFFLLLHGGLIVLFPCGRKSSSLAQRIGIAVYALIVTAILCIAIHYPVYLNAQKRGFGENFLDQYREIPRMLTYHLQVYVTAPKASPIKPAPPAKVDAPAAPIAPVTDAVSVAKNASTAVDPGTRPRPPASDILKSPFPADLLVLAIYLPIVLSLFIIFGAGGYLILGLLRRDERILESALTAFAVTGSAFVFFPQYYYFRPDLPHLSEFMCSFLVALAVCSFFALRIAQRHRHARLRVLSYAFLALTFLDMAGYLFYADKKESAGTSAASHFRNVEFKGENGVHVLLRDSEAPVVQGIYDAIMAHSNAEDYVVCYPYSPTVNFMTNRKSYLRNLYVDNATAPKKFREMAVKEIDQFHPAVILIDNRKINGTESSQFSHWASDTYQFIRQNYVAVGTFGSNEVYVRPDKAQPPHP